MPRILTSRFDGPGAVGALEFDAVEPADLAEAILAQTQIQPGRATRQGAA